MAQSNWLMLYFHNPTYFPWLIASQLCSPWPSPTNVGATSTVLESSVYGSWPVDLVGQCPVHLSHKLLPQPHSLVCGSWLVDSAVHGPVHLTHKLFPQFHSPVYGSWPVVCVVWLAQSNWPMTSTIPQLVHGSWPVGSAVHGPVHLSYKLFPTFLSVAPWPVNWVGSP